MQYGFWSVVPPLLTIILALITKNVFVSLFIGVCLGSLILADWAVLTGVNNAFYSFVHTFESNSNTILLMSMLLIGALIYLIEKSGGIDGFVEIMVKTRTYKEQKGRKPFHLASRHRCVYLRFPFLYGYRLRIPSGKRRTEGST